MVFDFLHEPHLVRSLQILEYVISDLSLSHEKLLNGSLTHVFNNTHMILDYLIF